ncbi:lasso peptide biosynthesis PqqD family chaperone [Phosphitispora sp. TUW77]|uniref:lasso peptide biosynthesis PqqD family chaperone n=1 Tax=Phosphitispora sp. TUW77 TaxID=3152361 RepID=UPI003AB5E505
MNTSQGIQTNHTVIRTKDNIVSEMDGEKVLLSIRNGKYYNLGKVGGRIWDLMESQISANDLIAVLVSEYEVAQHECEEQVISFLEHLLKEGLIISDAIIAEE